MRGAGGRAQLGETLTARGAHVTLADIYRRVPQAPDWAVFAQLQQQGMLTGLLIASSEAAEALFATAGSTWRPVLAAQRFFTLHPRIAERLQQLGASDIVLCDGSSPALAGLLAG